MVIFALDILYYVQNSKMKNVATLMASTNTSDYSHNILDVVLTLSFPESLTRMIDMFKKEPGYVSDAISVNSEG